MATFSACTRFFDSEVLNSERVTCNVGFVEFMSGFGDTAWLLHNSGMASFTVEIDDGPKQDCCSLVHGPKNDFRTRPRFRCGERRCSCMIALIVLDVATLSLSLVRLA